MPHLPFLFSALLLITSSSSIACGMYATRGTYKPLLNKLLISICIAIQLWSLGLAIRVCAAGQTTALLGSYLAPLGYAPLFGLLLHYILELTGQHLTGNQKWLYILIYLPGAVTAFGLSVFPVFGVNPPVLSFTALGWVNDSWNPWIWFYYVYYATFLVITFMLLWRWGHKSDSELVKRQAHSLLHSIFAMALLGLLTDVLPSFLHIQFPGIAAFFAIIPILTICRFVNEPDFTRSPETSPDEIILNKASRMKNIYLILSSFFFAVSLLNLISQMLLVGETCFQTPLLFSGLLAAAGLLTLFYSGRLWDDGKKELALSFLFAVSIPIIMFGFSRMNSISIWALVVLPLIPSMLFNRRILLSTVLVSGFQAQLVLAGAQPNVYVQVDGSDHIVRIALTLMAAFFCVFVSLVYRHRLQENAMHTMQQRATAKISQTLLLADQDNRKEQFTQALDQIGLLFQCQQVCFYLLDQDRENSAAYCEWHKDTPSLEDHAKSHLLTIIREHLQPGQILTLCTEDILVSESVLLQADMRRMHLRCIIAAPILRDGSIFGFLCLGFARPTKSEAAGFLHFLPVISNMFGDTLAKLEALDRMHFMAYHDQLTGLPNRVLLAERLNQKIRQAMPTGDMLGLIFLDLDAFKSINDTMGHEIGDRLLIRVSEIFSGCIDAQDTVARFGGDEFVILLSQISNEQYLHHTVQRIMELIHCPVTLQGQEFFVSGSAGVALYPRDGHDAETLIAAADVAMYHAKLLGKNRYVLCSEDLKKDIVNQMKLTHLLYSAQELGQLQLYYQPQISLETQEVTGMEALLRWNLPGYGLLSPGIFIPLAEKAGLIQSIGSWVLETACRQSRLWIEEGFAPIRMAVNVSVQQLASSLFVEQVTKILKRTGLDAQLLELELTESVANSGITDIVKILTDLKHLGVSLSIDDFGTEYSSLSRLKTLPIDRLKLDMEFVHGIESSEKDRAITKTIILLAKSLNIKVIAEGVETSEQLQFLQGRLCDEVQGFYYYRPMPADEAVKYLRRRSDP